MIKAYTSYVCRQVFSDAQNILFSSFFAIFPKVWDLAANKCIEVMTDPQNHPIQSLSMATNASVIVGANNKGTVYVFSPGTDTKASAIKKIKGNTNAVKGS